jgi:SOS response regulatory protein OraA/RecX
VLEGAIDQARRALNFDDVAAARQLLAKKRVDGVKAARFLASRGYSHELIERLVGTLGADG